MPLARALTDAREHRNAAVGLDYGADQLGDQHGLADPRAAEEPRLTPTSERGEEVDDLDAGFEQRPLPALTGERRRGPVDGPARCSDRNRRTPVADLPKNVDQSPQHHLADGHGDRSASGLDRRAAAETLGALHRDGPHGVFVEIGLNFGDQRSAPGHLQSFVDRRQRPRVEPHIDDRASHGDDGSSRLDICGQHHSAISGARFA